MPSSEPASRINRGAKWWTNILPCLQPLLPKSRVCARGRFVSSSPRSGASINHTESRRAGGSLLAGLLLFFLSCFDSSSCELTESVCPGGGGEPPAILRGWESVDGPAGVLSWLFWVSGAVGRSIDRVVVMLSWFRSLWPKAESDVARFWELQDAKERSGPCRQGCGWRVLQQENGRRLGGFNGPLAQPQPALGEVSCISSPKGAASAAASLNLDDLAHGALVSVRNADLTFAASVLAPVLNW